MKWLILPLLFFILPTRAEIISLVGYNYTLPLADVRDEEIRGGLIYDMSLALGLELKQDVSFFLYPRKRFDEAIKESKVDLLCYVSPVWLNEESKTYHFSKPLFQNKTYLVSLKEIPVLLGPEKHKNIVVGTVLGFKYPLLDKIIEESNGRITREDATNLSTNYERLFARRVDYIAVNEIEHNYFMKITDSKSKFRRTSERKEEVTDIGCMLSKDSKINKEDFDKAIDNIIRKKIPQQWLNDYK